MTTEPTFARLVSLACHDVRTPLATVHGFTRTLRKAELPEPHAKYVEMIEAAAGQIADLVAELSLAARIEGGRYEPRIVEADSLALADAARELVDPESVTVSGRGAPVAVDEPAVTRGLAALVHQALRYSDEVAVEVDGPLLRVAPVTPASEPVLTGAEYRDLGAAVAVLLVRALGGEVAVADGALLVRLRGPTRSA